MRRLLPILIFVSLIGISAVPSVGYGQGAGILYATQSASASNAVIDQVNLQAATCGVNAAGGTISKFESLANASGLLASITPVGALSTFASSIPGIGSLTKKLGGLFGGGGDNEEMEKILNEICTRAEKQVALMKKQIADENRAKAAKKWGAVAYKNAINLFFRTLAYRAAVGLSKGAPGQKPLFETKPEEILKDALDMAAGEFLNKEMGKYWSRSLCEPFTPFAKLNVTLTVRRIVEPTRPRCTFSEIMKTLDGDLKNLKLKDIAKVQTFFNPSGNDLGATLTLLTNFETRKKETEEITKLRKWMEKEFKSLVSPITGLVKTPAKVMEDIATEYYVKGGASPYLVYTGEALADAIGVFVNTLAGRLLDQALRKGFNPQADIRGGNLFSLGVTSVQAAMQKFMTIIQQPDLRVGGPVEILQELVARKAPSGTDRFENPIACTIDEKFRLAVEQKLTVKQAIEGNYLSGTRPFGSKARGQKKESDVCDDPQLYSLRSITILRKYRIVPVGWELAAQYIAQTASHNQPQTNFNLNYLISKYSDPGSPFYRLVDEYWVLKAPENFIRRQGFSPISESEAITDDDGRIVGHRVTREPISLDEQSCIKENPDGSCAWFGYCTEEKPIWKIKGEECPAQFNTCRTLTKRTGETQSLLVNTTDRDAACGFPEAVGCREYCTVHNEVQNDFQCAPQDNQVYQIFTSSDPTVTIHECTVTEADGTDRVCNIPVGGFKCTLPRTSNYPARTCYYANGVTNTAAASARGIPASLYVNKEAKECSADAAGCNQYLKLRNIQGELLPATDPPGQLVDNDIEDLIAEGMLYDGDGDGQPDATLSFYQSRAVVEPIYLKGDIQICDADYVGCDLYTPTNGEPPIPGIAGDMCRAECEGFRSYKEGYSYFDPVYHTVPPTLPAWPEFRPKPDDVPLIAKLAKTCNAQAAGCEEFTNLEEVAQGGEGKEYYTYLRQCVKPGIGAGEQVFYTWEGSDTKGFQLKEWFLQAAGSFPAGTPCGTETPSDATDDPDINGDCRQFYNTSAQTSWRLQSTTVFASDDCKQYRRTLDQSLWNTIPSQGKRCSAQENMCLQYKGVNANNIRIVRLGNSRNGIETFEDRDTIGWSGGAFSTNAFVAPGSSMQISGQTSTETKLNLKKGAVYQLSFWMTGSATDLIIRFVNSRGESQSFNVGGTTPTNEWQYFQFSLADPGFLTITPDLDETTSLELTAVGTIFIDNIVLRETPDSLFLIKDSWVNRMPQAADGSPLCTADQLNCQAYTDRKGVKRYIRNFAQLCPMEFVGCTAMVDTKNSSKVAATSPAFRGVANPADSLAYVIDNPENYCQAEQKGCMRLGLDGYDQNRNRKLTASYKIVNPDKFQESLCEATQNFCDQWTTESTMGSEYFRDPTSFLCEFKTGVVGAGGAYIGGGWFLRGTNTLCPTIPDTNTDTNLFGHCFGGRSTTTEGLVSNICRKNSDCTNAFIPGSTGACVPANALIPGSTNVYTPTPYAALCPGNEDSCSEFQDPQRPARCDKTLLYGQSAAMKYPTPGDVKQNNFQCDYYYYLKDSLETSGCVKQNPDEGCVGFLDTERPATFSSQAVCLSDNGTIVPGTSGQPQPCTTDADCGDNLTERCGYP